MNSIVLNKRVKSHILEHFIQAFMLGLGILAFYILYYAIKTEQPSLDLAILEVMIMGVIAILAQTTILLKLVENTRPGK